MHRRLAALAGILAISVLAMVVFGGSGSPLSEPFEAQFDAIPTPPALNTPAPNPALSQGTAPPDPTKGPTKATYRVFGNATQEIDITTQMDTSHTPSTTTGTITLRDTQSGHQVQWVLSSTRSTSVTNMTGTSRSTDTNIDVIINGSTKPVLIAITSSSTGQPLNPEDVLADANRPSPPPPPSTKPSTRPPPEGYQSGAKPEYEVVMTLRQ